MALRRAALALLPPPDDSLKWFEEPDAPDGEDAGDGRPADLGALALALAAHFGQSPEYWLWECSDDDFWGAICLMHDEAEAEADRDHRNADGWFLRHRRALARYERALAADVAAWMEAEDAKAAAEAAERAARKTAREAARAAQAAPPAPEEAPHG